MIMKKKQREKTDPGERIDRIGFGELKLIQNPRWFCYGIDAVLLGDFAKNHRNARITDLGTGTGILPLILYHKAKPFHVTGVEVQEEVAEMARRTVELNALSEKITILKGNVKDAASQIGRQTQDAVVTNPPYMAAGEGILNEAAERAAARHEILGSLEDFISCASEILKEGGSFYMIHRPHRMVDVMVLCRRYRLEPKQMQLIQPRKDQSPNLFLLHCVKYGRPELKILEPLWVYEEEGGYSQRIRQIYERT